MTTAPADEAHQHQILATSSPADEQDRVLKHGETFAVMNRWGDIRPVGLAEEGIYHEGTRHVSRLELRLGRHQRPLMLSSNVKENNVLLAVDLTNLDAIEEGRVIGRGSLHINRSKFLRQGVYYERVSLTNFSMSQMEVGFSMHWGADFVDVFEVRGHQRKQRGELLTPAVSERSVVFLYKGLDDIVRRSRIECSPAPKSISGELCEFEASLASKESAHFYLTILCYSDESPPEVASFDEALLGAESSYESRAASESEVTTSNQQFNYFLSRSQADLRMMISATDHGPYPYAGIPWYSTIFGRDGILTALQMLWLSPELAKGVLLYLASRQAQEVCASRDSEPGKILHEVRLGELANLNEIPFGLYYGSVDSTPLFVTLACEYFERTDDRETLLRLWPHVERALIWMDEWGDADGDGYVEYAKQTERGLTNQGWKDSHDSVFHADGSLAEPPIAICEVQAYVYEARSKAALVATQLGKHELAARLSEQASRLRESFIRDFWVPELGTYALALDGKKRQCRVRTSNAGHCLFSGIADPAHAREIAQSFMSREFFSGWGIRTVSGRERRYSPISYHNGTIWPHDNAMISLGLARYGHKEATAKLLSAFFDVSRFAEFQRLPELFCGFDREPSLAPTLYPVACKPQAWASGSVFMLLQACLGLKVDGITERLHFSSPVLPECLRELKIRNLQIGRVQADLVVQSFGDDVSISVARQSGDIQVIINKSGRGS